MTQVTRPDRIKRITPAQDHAHRDLALLHDALAILFTVQGIATALHRHMHLIQVKVNATLIQIINASVPHSGQNAAQVRVTGKKSSLHQGGMGNGIRHLAAFGLRFSALDLDGNELGGPLAIPNNRLSQFACHFEHSHLECLTLRAVQRLYRGMSRLVRGNYHK